MAKKITERPEDKGELLDLYQAGTRVWNTHGTEYALTLGWEPIGNISEAGKTNRIAVIWRDGKVTWPFDAAILNKNGRWQIVN